MSKSDIDEQTMKDLDEILDKFARMVALSLGPSKLYNPRAEAKSQILKLIKLSLPKEMTQDITERDAQMNRGWNACLSEVKKRLGVDDE